MVRCDLSKSLMALGANSYHSIATPFLSLRETMALMSVMPDDGAGSGMPISMRVLRRQWQSGSINAPLKLRFLT